MFGGRNRMDPDTEDAALAFQQELECRDYQEFLATDPGYHEWIETMNERERYENE